ncbi:hypothetical protein LXL04_029968 [Taraxacum kok-saghyz]
MVAFPPLDQTRFWRVVAAPARFRCYMPQYSCGTVAYGPIARESGDVVEEDEEIEIVCVGYNKPEIKDELPEKVPGGGANCWAVGDGWRRMKSSTGGVMGEVRDATGGCCLLAEVPGRLGESQRREARREK